MRAPSGGRSSSWESSALATRRGRCGDARGSSGRSSSRDARASPPRRRSASTRSASLYWIRGDLAGAEELLARSIELFGALAGSPERIPSPVNIAEIRAEPGGRPGLRIVFEDTLQPFVEISCDAAVGYVLANQAGSCARAATLARARALLDESAARFEDAGDELGTAAVLVRRAYLELAEGELAAARLGARAGARAAARAGDGAVSGSCSPGSG